MPVTRTWIGEKYGRLSIIALLYKKDRNPYFQCLCECGNKTIVVGHLLRSNKAKSCGCLRKETSSKLSRIDITGKRFGRLVVTEYSHFERGKDRKAFWKCKCDCGNEIIASASNLKAGNTSSCGCYRDEVRLQKTTRENNPMWMGGVSGLKYPVGWNKKLRKKIRERDNFTCVLCRTRQDGRNLDVHHIDYNKNNISPTNLITLCNRCHVKTGLNRDSWIDLFSKYLTHLEAI